MSKELTQLNPTVLPGDNTKPGSILKEAEKSLVSIGKSLKNLTGTSDKVQEQTQTSDKEGDASQTSEPSIVNVYDNKEEDTSNDEEEEEEEEETSNKEEEPINKDSPASTIYFVKDGIQMWFVRNVSHFKAY